MSPASKRSRFFENVEWFPTASSMPRPTNQRNSRSNPAAPSVGAPSGSSRTPAAGAPQQLFGRDRRSSHARIEVMEARRERCQRVVDDHLDGPQRMGSRHPGLQIDVAEQRTRPLIRPAHPASSRPASPHLKGARASEFFNGLLSCSQSSPWAAGWVSSVCRRSGVDGEAPGGRRGVETAVEQALMRGLATA
jgi:hypothetical protein